MRTAPHRPDRSTTHRRVAAVAVVALTLAACGEGEATDTDDTDDEVDDAAEAADEVDDPDTNGDAATVAIGSTDLGEVLVGGEGMTLYLFDPDDQGASTCYDDCADAWPPLIDEDPVAGDGVDDALLGTTEREDGEPQVTYDGWPVYHWASDQGPGDATGQGVQDVWWVIEADGTPVRDTDESDTDDPDEDATDEDATDEDAGY